MNIRAVIHAVASLMVVVGLAMLTAVPVSTLMGDSHADVLAMASCALGCIVFGTLAFVRVKQKGAFGFREGFAVVGFGWIVAAIFGCLPFILIGHLRWYDAFFETLSGFTTTGASVLEKGLPLNHGGALAAEIGRASCRERV